MSDEKNEKTTKKKPVAKTLREVAIEAAEKIGVAPEYVFAWHVYDDGRIWIVTAGGQKVEIVDGEADRRLTDIQITGVNPKAKKRTK
jgi:hypothetical protein